MNNHKDQQNKEFLEDVLSRHNNFEVDEEAKIIKKPKNKKKKKIPPYKKASHWIGAFLLLPVLLSGIFMTFVIRAESFLGKESLQWLAKQDIDDSMAEAAKAAGLGWLPEFLAIYNYRWIIMISLFTICFFIAGIIMVMDNKKYNDNKKANDNTEEDIL